MPTDGPERDLKWNLRTIDHMSCTPNKPQLQLNMNDCLSIQIFFKKKKVTKKKLYEELYGFQP